MSRIGKKGESKPYDKEIIHSLLNHGADVNKQINGTRPFTSDKGINDPNFLYEKSMGMYLNLYGFFQKGSTVLHMAAINGLDEIALFYLKKGANANIKNNLGWSPLYIAASRGRLKVAKLLLEHGADINAEDNDGLTPLMMAAGKGNLEVVQLLIKQGADSNAKDNKDKTALDYAQEYGHKGIVDFLERP